MLKFNSETVKLPCDIVLVADIQSWRGLALDMLALVDKHKGFGLAANQVGHNIQLIVITCGGVRWTMFNPEIERAWGGLATMTETCLSAPGQQVRLVRHKRVRVSGFNIDGEPVIIKARGILARVYQHEIDHMAGITIQDRKRLGVHG